MTAFYNLCSYYNHVCKDIIHNELIHYNTKGRS